MTTPVLSLVEPDVYLDFSNSHLPDLFRYVTAIAHIDEDGNEAIGSGVFVQIHGRHFVATARHCIENNPRLLLGDFSATRKGIVPDRPVQIIQSGWHETLDIGFLETTDLNHSELSESHLCFEKIVAGPVHVVGHPEDRQEVDKRRREISLFKCAFGTTLIEETDVSMKFAYPVEGVRVGDNKQWEKVPFPKTPRGFSGGAVFGVSNTSRGNLQAIEYKLLGIQCSWSETARWVKAVPIKCWHELIMSRYS
jgi:hypothetical protein